MDKKRREQIREIMAMLDNAALAVEMVCDKEEDCMDNYPENFQSTERYERMENAVDNMNCAMERLDEAKEYLLAAIGG